jgi:UDP-glucose 4-epimerase
MTETPDFAFDVVVVGGGGRVGLPLAVAFASRELAEVIWRKINGDAPLTLVSDRAYEYDVQKRVPDVAKAKGVLGFECTTPLDEMLDEVVPWVTQAVADGRL